MREMEHRMDTCSANAGSGNKMDGRVNERMNEQMTGPTLIPRVTVPASVWHGLKLGSTRIHPPSHEDNIQFQFPTFISHCGEGQEEAEVGFKTARKEGGRKNAAALGRLVGWLVGWSVAAQVKMLRTSGITRSGFVCLLLHTSTARTRRYVSHHLQK